MRRRLLSALIVSVITLTEASRALAECAALRVSELTNPQLMPLATIFRGTVRSVQPRTESVERRAALVQTITFDVDRVWRGDARTRMVLHEVMFAETVRLEVGRRYVVVAGPPFGMDDDYLGDFARRAGLNQIERTTELTIGMCVCPWTDDHAQRLGIIRQLGSGRSVR